MNNIFLKKLKYQYSNWAKQTITFTAGINVLLSDVNSVGKTTLIRIILYALGFPVKATKGVDFEYLKYELSLKNHLGQDVEITKNEHGDNAPVLITIGNNSYTKLRSDAHEIFKKYIFGIESDLIIENLLGSFYFDQEKGWNVLNRGRVIGSIRFSIEDFLRGLGDADTSNLRNEIANLTQARDDYRKFLKIVELSDMPFETSDLESSTSLESQEGIKSKILMLNSQIKYFESELSKLESILNEDKNLAHFITTLKLFVKVRGESVRVTSSNLEGFSLNQKYILSRVRRLKDDIHKLKNERDALTKKNTAFLHPDSLLAKYKKRIKEVGFSIVDLQDSISMLNIKIKDKEQELDDCISDTYFKYVNTKISEFLSVLEVRNPYPDDFEVVLLNKLYPLSGAELYKHIIAFKFSYVLALREKFGINLPIVIDSPYAKELDDNNFEKVLKIISKDFTDNQIIIASIRDTINLAHNRISIYDGVLEHPVHVEFVSHEHSLETPTVTSSV